MTARERAREAAQKSYIAVRGSMGMDKRYEPVPCADAASDVWEIHYRKLLMAARDRPYVELEALAKECLGALAT